MRVPVGILLISGMVVFLYLFGLLVAYKHREVTGSLVNIEEYEEPEDQTLSFTDNLESALQPATSDILR